MIYHQGLFEWTHFKVFGDGLYLLVLIIAIINQERLGENGDEFEAKVDKDSVNLVGEFS